MSREAPLHRSSRNDDALGTRAVLVVERRSSQNAVYNTVVPSPLVDSAAVTPAHFSNEVDGERQHQAGLANSNSAGKLPLVAETTTVAATPFAGVAVVPWSCHDDAGGEHPLSVDESDYRRVTPLSSDDDSSALLEPGRKRKDSKEGLLNDHHNVPVVGNVRTTNNASGEDENNDPLGGKKILRGGGAASCSSALGCAEHTHTTGGSKIGGTPPGQYHVVEVLATITSVATTLPQWSSAPHHLTRRLRSADRTTQGHAAILSGSSSSSHSSLAEADLESRPAEFDGMRQGGRCNSARRTVAFVGVADHDEDDDDKEGST